MAEDRYRGHPRAAELLDRVRHLAALVTRENAYDVLGWESAIDELARVPINDDIRSAYETTLQLFPTAAPVWVRYAELELGCDNINSVKQIFGRCLLNCPSVDLWRVYLKFITKVNEKKGPEGLFEVKKAYEFTVDCLGHDINAGLLWQEYVNLLQAPKPGTPAFAALFGQGMMAGQMSGQEEAHRATVLRRAYHRAIVVPMHQLDAVWRMYEAFENSTGNKQLARKMVDEQRPKYQSARLAYRERTRKLENLKPDIFLPLPPGRGGPLQEHQVNCWK